MAELMCEGRRISLRPEESVLTALERSGISVPSSCRAGACQSCLVQVTRGTISGRAQVGLKESLRAQSFVLACQAVPTDDWEVSLGAARALEVPAHVEAVTKLADDVVRVLLRTDAELGYRAGQFVTLLRNDGVARTYSIASLPTAGQLLELHVRVLPGGTMSSWLATEAALGASLRVRGPSGECFYTEGKPEQPLVLAGAGTGLAPLWGIVRAALEAGHRGPIALWHGARSPRGLYLRDELARLAADHPHVSYRPCVLEGDGGDLAVGKLDELVLASTTSFAEQRFFLCGDAPLVQSLKRALFLRGAALANIFADAFVASAT